MNNFALFVVGGSRGDSMGGFVGNNTGEDRSAAGSGESQPESQVCGLVKLGLCRNPCVTYLRMAFGVYPASINRRLGPRL